MIFPGMDPYLEGPALWQGLHIQLISQIANSLQPLVEPRYVAAVGVRVYVEGPRRGRAFGPDVGISRPQGPTPPAATAVAPLLAADEPIVVQLLAAEIREGFIEIRNVGDDDTVIAVIEVVRPTNKFAGKGRRLYRRKQRQVLRSQAHLIEIDLLRMGPHVIAVSEQELSELRNYDYMVCVNRAQAEEPRDQFEVYPRTLRERLPNFRLPLANGDPDVVFDLQAALAEVYRVARFGRRTNYDRPCVPPLSPDDQAWADELIRAARAST
jgi:hypothetical protein